MNSALARLRTSRSASSRCASANANSFFWSGIDFTRSCRRSMGCGFPRRSRRSPRNRYQRRNSRATTANASRPNCCAERLRASSAIPRISRFRCAQHSCMRPGYAMSWNVDGEGRVYSTYTNSNPLASTLYNAASQPTQVNFGNGDSDSFSYDANTSRMTQYQFNVNGSPLTGVLGWNANGTLQTQNITDPFNSADTQNCSYSYDDLSRLTGAPTVAAQRHRRFLI